MNQGTNTLHLEMDNAFGAAALRIDAASTDWNTLILLGLVVGAMALTCQAIIVWSGWAVSPSFRLVLLGAVAVRLIYFSATPYTVRSYDSGGHIYYIRYVAQHLGLPEPHSGWETHQPPMYYIFLGLWTRVSEKLALPEFLPLRTQWQLASLVMSLATFGVCAWIVRCLYPRPKEHRIRLVLLSALAVFPGIVYHATRISNDVPFGLLSFIWLGLLVKFWRDGTFKGWLAVSAAIGAGMLTKNCALAFIPASGLCLLFAKDLSWKRKALWAAAGAAIVLLIAGWFQLPRALAEGNATTFVVANMHDMPAGLQLDHSLDKLLSFNPAQVVAHPFNSSLKGYPRRDYFPEYFFKSAFVGEWVFADHLRMAARALLLPSLVLLGVAFCRMISAVLRPDWSSPAFPLLVTFWCFVGMQALWVWREPYSNNQDFRYFIVLVVPVMYFALPSIWTPGQAVSTWGERLGWLAVLNGALFIVLLSWL